MENMHSSPVSFHDACSLLSLGDTSLVQGLLQQPALYRRTERAYLQAWICCDIGLLDTRNEMLWEEAVELLLEERVTGMAEYASGTQGLTLRRKRPWVLWLLGNMAFYLRCSEAHEHYTKAIKLLNERRMNIPLLRIHVLNDQARCVAKRGAYESARMQYELALALCLNEEAASEALADIYAGLCGVSIRQGKCDQAIDYGKKARLVQKDERTSAHLLCTLGELYLQKMELADAATAYKEVLFYAEQAKSAPLRIESLLGLALVHLNEQSVMPARNYCIQALTLLKTNAEISSSMRGKTFLVCGKVAQLQSTQAKAQQVQTFQEEALSCYIQALEFSKVLEIRTGLAQLLEEILILDAGTPQPFWHKAYRALMQEIQ